MMGWLNDFLPKSTKHPGDFHANEFVFPAVLPRHILSVVDRALFFWWDTSTGKYNNCQILFFFLGGIAWYRP
jgi:hypothetical protein